MTYLNLLQGLPKNGNEIARAVLLGMNKSGVLDDLCKKADERKQIQEGKMEPPDRAWSRYTQAKFNASRLIGDHSLELSMLIPCLRANATPAQQGEIDFLVKLTDPYGPRHNPKSLDDLTRLAGLLKQIADVNPN